jgi:hypothetical protein
LPDSLGDDETQDPLRTHSIVKMALQFERKYSTQGSGAPCHVSFGFFSGFYGISLAKLQIDPQLESMIQPKAQGPHSMWNVILRIKFSIWFLLQDNTSTIEDLQEKNSGTLGNYLRELQDYFRISWSTFQPRDASSILEDFRLVVCNTPPTKARPPSPSVRASTRTHSTMLTLLSSLRVKGLTRGWYGWWTKSNKLAPPLLY